MITEKLQMGDFETDSVIYKGTNLVAHRRRKDTGPQFTLKELQHIVKCWNNHNILLDICKEFADIFPESSMSELDDADFKDRANRIWVASQGAKNILGKLE